MWWRPHDLKWLSIVCPKGLRKTTCHFIVSNKRLGLGFILRLKFTLQQALAQAV
jgi:hypothetical protein